MKSLRDKVNALYPLVFLVGGLVFFLILGERDILLGTSQSLLIFSGLIAVAPELFFLIKRHGFKNQNTKTYIFKVFSRIHEGIRNVSLAIAILFLVGALIASWSVSGILAGLIQLGIQWIHPPYFLATVCLSSALVSIASGSSWSTAGTIGVAFMGLGDVLDYSLPWVAGAVLSGAYFGDKMSPLSDTTNLASGIAKVPLAKHIRYMLPTSLLSFGISIMIYLLMGLGKGDSAEWNPDILRVLQDNYTLDVWKILIPCIVLISVAMGVSAIPSLGLGVLAGWILAWAQGKATWNGILALMVFGFESTTGNPDVDELLSGGGFMAILPTVFLILSAMVFGGCMEGSGKIQNIVEGIRAKVKTPEQLVLFTMYFSYTINSTTCDQYLSLVIPGRTLRDAYKEMDIDPRILSRALEDSGTVSSPLIPWNSCGAFMSSTLGVAVVKYLPFCFFHWIQMGISLVWVMVSGWRKVNGVK